MVFEMSGYNTGGWPRGGAKVAQAKEYSTLSTSSSAGTGANPFSQDSIVLPATTSKKFYLLWGLTAVSTSTSTAFMGSLYQSDGSARGGTLDSADLFSFASQGKGPFVLTLTNPLKLTAGTGLKLNSIVASGGNDFITIFYTEHTEEF